MRPLTTTRRPHLALLVAASLAVTLSACGGTVVFEEPGEGGASGEGGSGPSTSAISSSRASSTSSTSVSSTNVSTGTSSCPQFACDGGNTCVDFFYVCDGFPDCNDGSDEFNCNPTCRIDEFTCSDGSCIPTDYVCDSFPDCLEGEDEREELCSPVECGQFELPCFDGLCIPDSFICDGEADCAQGEDEDFEICQDEICGYDSLSTGAPAFTYCLSYYCCAEFDFCVSSGEAACVDCLNEGGGQLCDDALACFFEYCSD